MKNNRYARLLTGLLCLSLLAGIVLIPAPYGAVASAADEGAAQTVNEGMILEDPAAIDGGAEAADTDVPTAVMVATATVTLKVRREPSLDSSGNGSIAEGDPVYILEMGSEWCKVDTGRNTGYVQTKYLKDIRNGGRCCPGSASRRRNRHGGGNRCRHAGGVSGEVQGLCHQGAGDPQGDGPPQQRGV
jgi:hypothetical protein